MQVRLDTLALTDDDRRAVRWATKNRRTPATREEVKEFLEQVCEKALADALYRYNGTTRS